MECDSKAVSELTDNYPEVYTHNEPFSELRTSLKKPLLIFNLTSVDRAADPTFA
jgi:hypothetical protein